MPDLETLIFATLLAWRRPAKRHHPRCPAFPKAVGFPVSIRPLRSRFFPCRGSMPPVFPSVCPAPKTDTLQMRLLVDPVVMVGEFLGPAQAVHDRIEANLQKSHTLATLRDTLLPKLLSGQVSVKHLPEVTYA